MSMDNSAGAPTTAGAEPGPAGSWDEVEAAQVLVQHRFRPRWWYHAPEAVLLALALALVARSNAPSPVILLLFVVMAASPHLYARIRRVRPSYWALQRTPRLAGVGCAVLVAAGLYVMLGCPGDPGWRSVLILGALIGMVLWISTQLVERLLQRGYAGAGIYLASRADKPRFSAELRDPPALRTVAALGMVSSLRVDALREDLDLPHAQTDRVLDELIRGLLIIRFPRPLTGGASRPWCALSPYGQRVLRSHLAALRTDRPRPPLTEPGTPPASLGPSPRGPIV